MSHAQDWSAINLATYTQWSLEVLIPFRKPGHAKSSVQSISPLP